MTGGPVRGWRPIRSLHRDDNGFSLVEAVVSITILGLLVALTFSGRSLIDNRRLAGGSWSAGGGCSGGSISPVRHLEARRFGSDTMTVSPFGSANAGAVTLSSPGGEQRGVTVTAAGRVTITR